MQLAHKQTSTFFFSRSNLLARLLSLENFRLVYWNMRRWKEKGGVNMLTPRQVSLLPKSTEGNNDIVLRLPIDNDISQRLLISHNSY